MCTSPLQTQLLAYPTNTIILCLTGGRNWCVRLLGTTANRTGRMGKRELHSHCGRDPALCRDSRNGRAKLRAHTMSSQQRDCLCATKGLNKYKEMGRKEVPSAIFNHMLSKEITSRGALAPLTGCKFKSLYTLTGQLSSRFYCLQPGLPPELPCPTRVQHSSEAEQPLEAKESTRAATAAATTPVVL